MVKIKGTTGSLGSKHELDKFYTKDSIAKGYIEKLGVEDYGVVIEPSAGGGAFSRHIDGIKAYDLDPESEEVEKADWFKLDKEQFKGKGRVLVVGNPPFGRQGNLAISFIKEADFADTIAFILPKSFKKITIKNKIPMNFWLTHEEDCPKNSFTLLGEDYDVPCVFQVWEKREELRTPIRLRTTSDYVEFTTKENSDFRVQRVGGNAGKAYVNLDVSEQSNYFIKNNTGKSNEELIDIINKLNYPSVDDTVGPRSLSKGEFIQTLEEAL